MRLVKLSVSVSNLPLCWPRLPNLLLCPISPTMDLICPIRAVVYCCNSELANVSRRLGSLERSITIVTGPTRPPGCGGGSSCAFFLLHHRFHWVAFSNPGTNHLAASTAGLTGTHGLAYVRSWAWLQGQITQDTNV